MVPYVLLHLAPPGLHALMRMFSARFSFIECLSRIHRVDPPGVGQAQPQ